MALGGPGARPPDEQPDPEESEAENVQDEHQQHPPRLPEELQVPLLPQLVPGQVAHDQQADQEEWGRVTGEKKEDHSRAILWFAPGTGGGDMNGGDR